MKINFDDNGWDVEYVPLKKEKNYIRLANKEDKEKILKDFISRSKQILNEEFIRDSFENLCIYKENSYIRALSGNKNIFEKIFIKIFKPKTNYFYNNTNLNICYDYILCESHNEIIKNILKRNLRNDV